MFILTQQWFSGGSDGNTNTASYVFKQASSFWTGSEVRELLSVSKAYGSWDPLVKSERTNLKTQLNTYMKASLVYLNEPMLLPRLI